MHCHTAGPAAQPPSASARRTACSTGVGGAMGRPGSLPGRLLPFQPFFSGRGQHPGAVVVRARAQPGGSAAGVHIAEQEQREQSAAPGADSHPPLPVRRVHIAAIEVPSDVPGIPFARKAGYDMAAHSPPPPPSPGSKQLVTRLLQQPRGTCLDERAALGAGDAHHRLSPRRRVLAANPVPCQGRPDAIRARTGYLRRKRPPDDSEPVSDECLDSLAAKHSRSLPRRSRARNRISPPPAPAVRERGLLTLRLRRGGGS
jgi:hypothetical protein